MSRYVLGSEKMFYDFVDSISKKDKIGIVTHTDLDGIASGIFLQKILESKDLKINFIEFLNYGPGALKKVVNRKFDVLFFTDWKTDDYPYYLNPLREKYKILVFDHHPYNQELKDKSDIIKTNPDYCSSHALLDLAKNKGFFDTQSLEWLACSAIIVDYTWDKNIANFEFIKGIYPEVKNDNSIWDSKPAEIGNKINGALIYYSPNYKKVYDLVLKGDIKKLEKADKIVKREIKDWIGKFERNAEYLPEKKLYFAYGNPKYNITSTIASILSDKNFRENTVIFASDLDDKKGFVKLSGRNQTGKVNLGNIFKKCAGELNDADGGGHSRAASAVIRKRDLYKFKERLLSEINS